MFQDDEYFALGSDDRGNSFVRSPDEVLALPLTADGDVLVSVEPSPAFGEPTIILPGGTAVAEEDHEETANRELQEELGYKAGHLDFLGELRPWSKYLTVRSYVYLARGLTPSRLQGDEDYEIGVERVPLDQFETLITSKRLLDARVIAALYMARAFLDVERQS